MIKFLSSAIMLLAAAYFGMGFMGYEIHAKNLSYYMPSTAPSSDGSNALSVYMDTVKYQNKLHPLISKKKGNSAAGKTDQSITDTMKAVMQVDKIQQFEKLKKDIDAIKTQANDRNKEVESIMGGMEQKKP